MPPRPANSTTAPRVRPVPDVTRAIAILRLLGRSRTPMGVKAIAQALKLVPSTCLHILRALVSEQLVRVEPTTKHYSLVTGMLPLARAVLCNSDFSSLLQPRLSDHSKPHVVTPL